MITTVIIALTALLFLIPTATGFVSEILLASHSVDKVIVLCLVGGGLTTLYVSSCFSERTFGRASLALWYSFNRSMMLGIGSGLAFATGSAFSYGTNLTSGILGLIALIMVAKACVDGPVHGWEAFISGRQNRYPYPTPPRPGYEYDP